MGYGFESYSSNGTLQITSEGFASWYEVADEGTGFSAECWADDLVFARRTGDVGATRVSGGAKDFLYEFRDSWYTSQYQAQQVSADYVILRRTSRLPPATGGYGLLVYDVAGNISFDSRLLSNNLFSIRTYIPPLELFGEGSFDGPVYSGSTSNIYACLNTSYMDFALGINDFQSGVNKWASHYFRFSSNDIQYFNMHKNNGPVVGQSPFWPNTAPIIIGELL